MTSPKGFSKSQPAKKTPSPAAVKRKAATEKYDDLKGQGLPEFNVYVRLPEKPTNWIPVGSLALKRSSVINQAIFQNEADLLKGALRLYPKLSKDRERLEYGYKLKDPAYKDEEIQLAVRPIPTLIDKVVATLRGWIQKLSAGSEAKSAKKPKKR